MLGWLSISDTTSAASTSFGKGASLVSAGMH
jgi:hypothetical protein